MSTKTWPVAWRVSSRSASGSGNCVEAGAVLDASGRVAVRNSRRPAGTVLSFSDSAWQSFVDVVRAGRMDRGAPYRAG